MATTKHEPSGPQCVHCTRYHFAADFAANLAKRLLAALLLAMAGQVWAQPVVVVDDRQSTVRLAAPPTRVVSLLPSITETVCALNRCELLVGTDRFSNWPESVKALPKLGGLEDTKVERIVALRPDVVLAPPASRVVDRLQSLGLPVVVLEAKTLADVQRVIQKLTQLLGLPNDGGLWRQVQAGIRAADQSIAPAKRGAKVYYEVDNAPYAAGEASFIGEIVTALGARNIVPASLGPFPRLNPEFIVRANPDVIMVSRRNSVGLLARPGWQVVRAVREQRVCIFEPEDSDVLVRPGPRMAQAARVMAQCLNDKSP